MFFSFQFSSYQLPEQPTTIDYYFQFLWLILHSHYTQSVQNLDFLFINRVAIHIPQTYSVFTSVLQTTKLIIIAH